MGCSVPARDRLRDAAFEGLTHALGAPAEVDGDKEDVRRAAGQLDFPLGLWTGHRAEKENDIHLGTRDTRESA